MDWFGEVSNFVMSATAHVIATVTTKILSHPDLQDVFAETVALVVQKLLIQGSTEEDGSDGNDNDNNDDDDRNSHYVKPFQKQQKKALRLFGKFLLKLGESNGNLTRETDGDYHSKNIDIAESHTESMEAEEEDNHSNTELQFETWTRETVGGNHSKGIDLAESHADSIEKEEEEENNDDADLRTQTRETVGDNQYIDSPESHTKSIEEEKEESNDTSADLQLGTSAETQQDPTRQVIPPLSVVADDLGKVDSPSFGTVETKDTADEDYHKHHNTASF